ncbi:hypothetical protein A7975_09435 [Bacillus sp. FJAT-26390]|nr:hypothetical protein A7975_09435 [Bacillus sp. FJAT-26390]
MTAMNSKKWFSGIIVLLLMISLLAGCAAPGQQANVEPNQTQESSEAQTEREANDGNVEQPTASSVTAEQMQTAVPTETPAETESAGKDKATAAASDKPGAAKPTPKPTVAPPAKDQKNQPIAKPSTTAQPVKTEKTAPTKAPQPANIVTISIIADEETGTVLDPTAVELKKDDTVLDVLKRITRKNKIQMEYKGLKATAYIEGIDNVYEFDRGAKSGWMYRVNGEFPNKSAGAYELKEGDVIEWLYTIDLGKDLGAEYE